MWSMRYLPLYILNDVAPRTFWTSTWQPDQCFESSESTDQTFVSAVSHIFSTTVHCHHWFDSAPKNYLELTSWVRHCTGFSQMGQLTPETRISCKIAASILVLNYIRSKMANKCANNTIHVINVRKSVVMRIWVADELRSFFVCVRVGVRGWDGGWRQWVFSR